MAINGVWTKITGIEESRNIVNAILSDIQYKTMDGLLAAAEYLYEDMQKTYPKVPISSEEVKAREKRPNHKAHLNDTWFAKPFNLVKTKPVVQAGFNSPHALWAHERVKGAKWGNGFVGDIDWTRPQSGPKFLEMAIKRNYFKIPNLVSKFVNPAHWKKGKYTPPPVK